MWTKEHHGVKGRGPPTLARGWLLDWPAALAIAAVSQLARAKERPWRLGTGLHRPMGGAVVRLDAGLRLSRLRALSVETGEDVLDGLEVPYEFSIDCPRTVNCPSRRARSHFSDWASSRARGEVAICFNIFHRPAL